MKLIAVIRAPCRLFVLAAGLSLLFGCTPPSANVRSEEKVSPVTVPPVVVAAELPPPVAREFRAAWVSTVANIDWPSRSNLSVLEQQAEINKILDVARSTGLNAIILQVRPSADAIYPSQLEPWSEYLTGTQGVAPQPLYDPLQMWIAGAHARGLELHAWFNPYRARHTIAKSPNAANHIAVRNPGVVKTYGKFQWMDPGEPAAVQQTLDVMLDVVRRYDVDGVHIDDYFYPYPIPVEGGAGDNGLSQNTVKAEQDFPDDVSWNRYLAQGGKLARADWRRENVNALIERIYNDVHKEKAWVKVGISPFGLPRPDRRPAGITGFSQYDKLYADAELWFNNGWLDYFTPQLYWPAAQAGQSFPVLLDYWITQNTHGRALWPGLYTSRIGDKSARAFAPTEILGQIDTTRNRSGLASGHVHFSMAALSQNREAIASTLAAEQYRSPALVPAMPWLDASLPPAPIVSMENPAGAAVRLKLRAAPGKTITRFVIGARCEGKWQLLLQPAGPADATETAQEVQLNQCTKPDLISVSAIDRFGNESKAVSLTLAWKIK